MALLAASMLMFGYVFLIKPEQYRNRFLQLQVAAMRNNRLEKEGLSMNEVKVLNLESEVLRFSSKQGRLLLWRTNENGQGVLFDWLGGYEEMLRLIKTWPSCLRIREMHWKRGKSGGVRWSGRYESAN